MESPQILHCYAATHECILHRHPTGKTLDLLNLNKRRKIDLLISPEWLKINVTYWLTIEGNSSSLINITIIAIFVATIICMFVIILQL